MPPARWPTFIGALQPQLSCSDVPATLPDDVSVDTLSTDLPPALRALAGLWQGWGGIGLSVDVRLLVERVEPDGATLRYAAADSSGRRAAQRLVCTLEGDELHAATDDGARVAFRLRDPDTAEFLWSFANGGWMCGVVTRIDPSWRARAERVPLPGGDDTLEAHVFAPAGDGPFPSLLFNHGSTGDGSDPSRFTLSWACLPLARLMTERGWLVVFPQRRGRGRSDGRYDEGFTPSRTRYSTKASVALAGLDRALEDVDACLAWATAHADIDASRLVVGGQSRGGALAIAAAGRHGDAFRGAMNFVGGWLGERAPSALAVNAAAFERGASFAGPTLWLYADDHDDYYSAAHARSCFEHFEAAGGTGDFRLVAVPASADGHQIVFSPQRWRDAATAFLDPIG